MEKKYSLAQNAFVEGFPRGVVALVKQRNGKYRLIVSRPPNTPDPVLARAEVELMDMLDDLPLDLNKKNPLFGEIDDDDE